MLPRITFMSEREQRALTKTSPKCFLKRHSHFIIRADGAQRFFRFLFYYCLWPLTWINNNHRSMSSGWTMHKSNKHIHATLHLATCTPHKSSFSYNLLLLGVCCLSACSAQFYCAFNWIEKLSQFIIRQICIFMCIFNAYATQQQRKTTFSLVKLTPLTHSLTTK